MTCSVTKKSEHVLILSENIAQKEPPSPVTLKYALINDYSASSAVSSSSSGISSLSARIERLTLF